LYFYKCLNGLDQDDGQLDGLFVSLAGYDLIEEHEFAIFDVVSSVRLRHAFGNIMSEDRFNALVLLFVHKDIELDIGAVIDICARKHPSRMILLGVMSHDCILLSLQLVEW